MRLAYTCQLTSKTGGLERILVDKANAMAERGHEVLLITNNPPGRAAAYAIDPRVQVADLGMEPPRGILQTLRYKWHQNRLIRQALRRFCPDVTIAVPTWLTMALLAVPGRLVIESHCMRSRMYTAEKSSIYKRFKVALAERKASALVTLTQEDSKKWPHARRCEVIPNFSTLHCDDTASHRHGAIAVGRLHPQKDFPLLLDAWAEAVADHPEASLRIYGEGPERPSIERQIKALGLTDSVQLCGNCADMAPVYASAEFLVMSSRYEGLPLVLIEAMQCGCPCVSVDCANGPRDVIADGRDGLLVPYRGLSRPERVRALAAGICSMLDNPDRTAQMGTAARLAARRFDRTSILNRWEQLFASLVRP